LGPLTMVAISRSMNMRGCRTIATVARVSAIAVMFGVRLAAQSARESVRPLPTPTGPDVVGTTVTYLVDSSRSDPDFRAGRPITLQLWYPAKRRTERWAPYLVERGLSDLLARQQYYGVDSAALSKWASLRTHSLLDAAPLTEREQWVKRGEAGRVAFDSLASRSRGPLFVASVAGTGHFSFTDGPFVMPSTITRFGGRIIDAQRGWTVISDAIRAFFDRELLGRGNGLAGVAAQHRSSPSFCPSRESSRPASRNERHHARYPSVSGTKNNALPRTYGRTMACAAKTIEK
jgi:hypothetical protein